MRRREPALGTDRKAFEGDEPAGICHASGEVLDVFELGPLRTHEPQYHEAVVGQVTQWLEGPRSLVVELEQETIEARAAEDLAGDPIVSTRRIEHALVIAAADVQAEGDA